MKNKFITKKTNYKKKNNKKINDKKNSKKINDKKNSKKIKVGAGTRTDIDNTIYNLYIFLITFIFILGYREIDRLYNRMISNSYIYPENKYLINYIRCHGYTIAGDIVQIPENINIITVVSKGYKVFDFETKESSLESIKEKLLLFLYSKNFSAKDMFNLNYDEKENTGKKFNYLNYTDEFKDLLKILEEDLGNNFDFVLRVGGNDMVMNNIFLSFTRVPTENGKGLKLGIIQPNKKRIKFELTRNKFNFLTLDKINTINLPNKSSLRELIEYYKLKSENKTIILYCCRVYTHIDNEEKTIAEDLVAREVSNMNKFQDVVDGYEEVLFEYLELGICNFCKKDNTRLCLNRECENYKHKLIMNKNKCNKCYKELENPLKCSLCNKTFCKEDKNNHIDNILENLHFMGEYIEKNKSFFEKQLEHFNYDEYMNDLDLNFPIKTSNYEIINDLNIYDNLITHITLYHSSEKNLLEKYLYYRKYQIIESISQLD